MTAPGDGTTTVVDAIPNCDIHQRMWGETVPAAYDARTNLESGIWAYMCDKCFPKWSAGKLGEGLGQRLILSEGADR